MTNFDANKLLQNRAVLYLMAPMQTRPPPVLPGNFCVFTEFLRNSVLAGGKVTNTAYFGRVQAAIGNAYVNVISPLYT